jgi:hypothetical protein
MAVTIYSLCTVTALVCACLLFSAYRRGRYRLLLWSGLGFAGLTLNNLALALDKLVFTLIDLTILRASIALLSFMIILYGLIWDAE